MPTYARANLAFEKGEGPYLYAQDGRRFLDFGSGIAVNTLGHSHPHLVAKLTEQVGKLWHTSNLYQMPGQEKLAKRLIENSFADTVFFCNSGAEANEAGIKMLRRYQYVSGHPEKNRILVATNAFHGRTLGTLTAGYSEKYREGFGPMPDGFDRVAFGNLNELRNAITPNTGGIILEPIQGEGGICRAPEGYLEGVRKAADEFGMLVMFDEVQTGIGRTGKLFAYQWSDTEPDIISSAKGLGGGFPIGALLANEKAAAAFTPGMHGTTFGGNQLATAAANAVLDEVLKPGFMDHVLEMSRLIVDGLEVIARKHPGFIEEVRGMGLLLGMKTKPANVDVVAKLREFNLLTVPAGDNVVRIIPPLNITKTHVDEALVAIDAAAAALGK
ncbi:MAG: aspartate aminotransferase family protein [Thalassospira sp.]|uniref:aspartate aminotransferase family protein n=1 Tax=Thalassospira sp. TaxID=1912094 RepID=UPI001B1A77EB|nr:aspartate aminotransferase family protein [Thalassospira sp.]MBO6581134.1 aspartate aminotransferase family protein [Thalassospira sp.]MBO6820396.1 aspartate aminotransferase family protein [Thalassospira sp.]MBO6887563.1 aspartate aminotransferase family protein [Thalassospira sp.]